MLRAPRRQLPRVAGRPEIALVIALGVLALLVASSSLAARRDYQFTRVGGSDGLLQRTVQAVLQDDQGFVWIGTQAGLQRFDGRQFHSVGGDPGQAEALPESFITALALDGRGQLWVGTNSHYLVAIDLASGASKATAVQGDPLRDRALAIRAAADGSLWVGTGSGIERFDPNSGTREEVLRLSSAPQADRRGMPRSISFELEASGHLLAATDGGLFRLDASGKRNQRIGPAELTLAVHRDASDRVWVGTATGLLELGAGDRLQPVLSADGSAIPATRRITSDAHGRLWLGLHAGGLMRFDPATRSRLQLDAQHWLPGSLHDAQVATLMVDTGGLLWVGGESFGLATTPVDGARFSLLIDPPGDGSRRISNNIRCLLEGEPGQLWAGTTSGSLKRIALAGGAIEEYIGPLATALALDSAAAAELRIMALAKSGEGRLWVATDLGLLELDPAQGQAQRLSPPDEMGPSAAGEPLYRTLLPARDGTLWIGTTSDGVLAYTPATQTWRRHGPDPQQPSGLGNSAVLSLFEDSRSRLWIGTLDGLFLLDSTSGAVQHLVHRSDDLDSLSNNLVRAIVETGDGQLWIANHGGLDRVVEDPASGRLSFQRHGTSRGLPSATVYGVLEDAKGKLWISSNLGIARLDPASGEVRSYGMSDGLQELEFNGGAQLRLTDGRLLFGGIRGINLFDPGRLEPSEFQPPVVLTSLQIGSDGGRRSFLRELSAIEAPHAARLLRLRFAALDYADPPRNRIQYRLEGFDSDWVGGGGTAEATYTNLDPGRYRLRVRGSNSDGVWSEQELSLPLRIIPAWWSSTPARVGYGLLLALVVALAWRLQARRRQQERALLRQIAQREERLKLALWGSGDEFWDWDIPSNVVHRIGADQLLGRASEEDLSTDDWRARAVHPEDLGRVQALLQAHITGQTPAFESEHRVRNARGEWVWVRSRGKVVERDAQNNALRIAGTARDITHSRFAERERRIASEVLSSMSEAVAVVDLEFRFVSVNPAFSRITGFTEAEVLGKPSSLLDSSQQQVDFYHQLRETAERVGHWKGEIWQRRKSGDEFLGWIELSEVRDNLGERTHFVAVVTDITDQKRAELELRYLANYDTLTGLPNRTLLGERLERAVVRARRANTRVAVLFLDLDRFKDINDSMGHAAGDRLLKAAAARLQETVREVDTVARLGGDEFTVVLEDIADVAAAEQMAARIVAAFEAPLEIEGRAETSISPSIGVSLYPDHAASPTDLLKFADTAMYRAKDRGRNTWQIYTETMDAETRRRASMMAALRKALDRGEFSLLFQPKMSLADGRITGVEALLRWQSDELGPVSPATFIPLAEETGLIVQIGEWVLREATMTLARWRRAGLDDLVMAVNISVLQLLRGQLPQHVAAVLEECNVPANRIELEVTESMVMANAEQAIRAMRELKGLGVSLAIDDFGTGYSSLIYLKRLPIDTLKIDKAFVGDLTTDPDDEAITATIITMAHSLDLNVVAEGAESIDQIEYLREQGCDEIQGYWLSWPLDDDRCLEFIRGWRPERLHALDARVP
jgi:diguanylate cyclase (GGDEF)-like protein/PAS domain S-box-containing protein